MTQPADYSKLMDINEFVELGLLQEINRRILHPCGLALMVTVEDDGSAMISGVLDARTDTEGFVFVAHPSETKAERATQLWDAHAKHRLEKYGWVVQPIGIALTISEVG